MTLILLVVTLLPMACGSQEKRPSQDVLLAREASRHIERMRSAYQGRSMSGLEALSTPEVFEGSISPGMKDFSSVNMEFISEWVEIRVDGTMEVRVGWSGSWTMRGGEKLQEKGKAVFVLGGSPMRLQALRGASPFSAPAGARQPL